MTVVVVMRVVYVDVVVVVVWCGVAGAVVRFRFVCCIVTIVYDSVIPLVIGCVAQVGCYTC